MHPDQTAPQDLEGLQRVVLVIAGIAAIVGAVGVFLDPTHFFRVYLIAFVLWTEIAVGCLGIVMFNNMVNARWLFPLQRFAEAGARTLPLMAFLFVPVVIGLSQIYPWMGEAGEELVAGQATMLQPVFFVIRTFIYFGIWIALAYVLTGWSYQQDSSDTARHDQSARNLSAVGMVIFVITTSLAAFDWTMSLDPTWFSSIYGWLSLSRAGLSTIALLILVIAFFWNRAPFKRVVSDNIIGDFAAVLLVAALTWVYMNVMQFVIIWAGNVSYFVQWYSPRLEGSWENITLVFWGINFFILVLLMIPGLKRIRPALVLIAAAILLMRVFELYWVVMPAAGETSYLALFSDAGIIIGMGGFMLLLALWFLGQQPLLPVHHPSLDEATFNPDAETNYDAKSPTP